MAKERCVAIDANYDSLSSEERNKADEKAKKVVKRRKLLDTSKKRQKKPIKTAGTKTPIILGISNAQTKKTCNKY